MDRATLFCLISLIPDRLRRSRSGCAFDGASSGQAQLLSSFLGWLAPLNPISDEEQQLLEIRAEGAKTVAEREDPPETAEALF